MAFSSISQKTTFGAEFDKIEDLGNGIKKSQKTIILEAMEKAYKKSAIARDMFDKWVNQGNVIQINYLEDEFRARTNAGILEIDLSYLKNLSYINKTGTPVSASLLGTLMHEFGHALAGKSDPKPLSDQATEYKGTNLPFVNDIWRQLGLQPMLSYFGQGYSNPDDIGYQKLGYNYAKGNPITDAVNVQSVGRLKSSKEQNWSTAKLSNKSSNVLLIGGSEDNKLTGGDGNDVFFGGGGNDILDGGGGTNTAVYVGNRDDYQIAYSLIFFGEPFLIYEKGSDDKYSAGEDQLINIKYLQFDDRKVALDPSGLIFDVATYVSPDINQDVNFIQLPTNDFNGDSNSDILWRNIDGSVAIWSLDGNAATPQSLGSVTLDWTIAGTGDFNGDLTEDILWRNDNGTVALWTINDSILTSSSVFGTVGTDWKIVGTGDFNGDSESDILWRNDNGTVALWQINDSILTTSNVLGTVGTDWKIVGTGDFNNDGESDILWRNDNGTLALWQINDLAYTAGASLGTITSDWKIAGSSDFNGDGSSDILWRNDNGTVALWQINDLAYTTGAVIGTETNDWTIAETGDFNGDGKSDILWRNDNGAVATWQMDGSYVVSASLTSIPSADLAWNIAAPILYT
jgi:FG-GAP-like repeat/RTX calcium-binding nonapeptide repeat (4 copies)